MDDYWQVWEAARAAVVAAREHPIPLAAPYQVWPGSGQFGSPVRFADDRISVVVSVFRQMQDELAVSDVDESEVCRFAAAVVAALDAYRP